MKYRHCVIYVWSRRIGNIQSQEGKRQRDVREEMKDMVTQREENETDQFTG